MVEGGPEVYDPEEEMYSPGGKSLDGSFRLREQESENETDLVAKSLIKKIEKGEKIEFNPLTEQRIIFYSKYSDGRSNISREDMSMKPILDYSPVIVGRNNEWQNNLGKIIEINEKAA